MKVQVLFFGATAEVVGERTIEIDLDAETKSAVAFKQIISAYPNLQEHTLLFAINQEYANGSETLNTGDELGIFTAVSGG
jgi:molybdopterin converting factor small subunit